MRRKQNRYERCHVRNHDVTLLFCFVLPLVPFFPENVDLSACVERLRRCRSTASTAADHMELPGDSRLCGVVREPRLRTAAATCKGNQLERCGWFSACAPGGSPFDVSMAYPGREENGRMIERTELGGIGDGILRAYGRRGWC